MFFNVKDLQTFQAQKEFIDTAVVPLVSLEFSEQSVKSSGSAVDYLLSLSNFIEQQFKGRLMMLPPFTYTPGTVNEAMLPILQKELQELGFAHVIFLTSDHRWTSYQEQHHVMWLPAIPLESMDQSMKAKILEDQLKQIIPLFTKVWSSTALSTS